MTKRWHGNALILTVIACFILSALSTNFSFGQSTTPKVLPKPVDEIDTDSAKNSPFEEKSKVSLQDPAVTPIVLVQVKMAVSGGELIVQTFQPGVNFSVITGGFEVQSEAFGKIIIKAGPDGALEVQTGGLTIETVGVFRLRKGNELMANIIHTGFSLPVKKDGAITKAQKKKPAKIDIIDK